MKLTLFLFAASLAVGVAARPSPIKVFVYTRLTEGNQFIDPDQKQRTDSVRDLNSWLGRKKSVELVSSIEQAQVTVEVTARGGQQTGVVSTGCNRGNCTSTNVAAAVDVELRSGSYSLTIEGQSYPGQMMGIWMSAAGNVSSQIDNWIKQNHDRLIAQK